MKEQSFPLSSENQERLNASFARLIESIRNDNQEEEEADLDDDDTNNNDAEMNSIEEEHEPDTENNVVADNSDDDNDDDSNFVIDDDDDIDMEEDDVLNVHYVNLMNTCLNAITVAMEHKCFNLIQSLIDTCHKTHMDLITFNDKKDGNTVLHYACRVDDDDVTVLKLLLQLYNKHYKARTGNNRNDIITSIRNNKNDTILHTACYSGNIQIVQYIMEYFQLDNITLKTLNNKYGATPFHVTHYTLDLVKYFIHTCHIDVEMTDVYNSTILHYASRNEDDEIIVHYLRTVCHANEQALNDAGRTALPYGYDYHQAAISGNLNNLIQCVENDEINVEATNRNGYTALLLACRYGHVNIVDYLIQKCHVIITASNRLGYNSLHIASKHGNFNVVEYLLQNNHIHIDSKDNEGDTALHHACREQHIEIVQYLIETCNALNVRNNSGATVLHCVSLDGSLEIMQYLMNRYELSVNVQDNDGDTPLHLACVIGQMKVVQYLIKEQHANLNIKDKNGFTPILTAMYNGELSIVQYMIDECNDEIDLTATTNKGLDLFDFAIKANKCNDFVLYILQTFSKILK